MKSSGTMRPHLLTRLPLSDQNREKFKMLDRIFAIRREPINRL